MMVENTLKKEAQELKKIIREAEKREKRGPTGTLRISKKKNGVEYYIKNNDREEKTVNGYYVRKNELKIAKEIAQRDYDTKLLKNAKSRLHAIEIFLRKYKEYGVKELFQKMHPCRRELIDEIIISDEEFVKRWSEVTYEGKQFLDDETIIVSERGERMRSKSEKIIADKLYMLGIPYRYEYPIVLEGKIKVYPDFTILKMPERKEVYLEHFGRLDDPAYVDTTIFKLNTYEKNGIYLGVNLFVTYETSKKPINIQALDKMLRALFGQ